MDLKLDIDHLVAELSSKDGNTSCMEPILPDLQQALMSDERALAVYYSHKLHRLGSRSTANAEIRLKELVSNHPKDLAPRILLLGYYEGRAVPSATDRLARQEVICWIIEHYPESKYACHPYLDPEREYEAYNRARGRWLQHVGRTEVTPSLLGNAASFFTLSERQLSEDLLNKAKALEPTNPEWPERLAHLYSLGLDSLPEEARRETAIRALVELEHALSLLSPTQDRASLQREIYKLTPEVGAIRKAHAGASEESLRENPTYVTLIKALDQVSQQLGEANSQVGLLPDLGRLALEAGQIEKAHAYASELLNSVVPEAPHWCPDGEWHFYGNILLGRVALRRGDKKQAIVHLLEAGRTTGGPVQVSFGPNMMLAKELLLAEERDAVIEYLNLCSSFWQDSDHRLQQWISIIRQGGMPDFGANVSY